MGTICSSGFTGIHIYCFSKYLQKQFTVRVGLTQIKQHVAEGSNVAHWCVFFKYCWTTMRTMALKRS